MKTEYLVIAGALCCAAPVVVGLIVNRWLDVMYRNGERLWP